MLCVLHVVYNIFLNVHEYDVHQACQTQSITLAKYLYKKKKKNWQRKKNLLLLLYITNH